MRQAGPAPLRARAGPRLRDPQEEHPALQQLHLADRLSPPPAARRPSPASRDGVVVRAGEAAAWAGGPAAWGLSPSRLTFGIKLSPGHFRNEGRTGRSRPRPRSSRTPPPHSPPFSPPRALVLGDPLHPSPRPSGAIGACPPSWLSESRGPRRVGWLGPPGADGRVRATRHPPVQRRVRRWPGSQGSVMSGHQVWSVMGQRCPREYPRG